MDDRVDHHASPTTVTRRSDPQTRPLLRLSLVPLRGLDTQLGKLQVRLDHVLGSHSVVRTNTQMDRDRLIGDALDALIDAAQTAREDPGDEDDDGNAVA